MRKVDRITAIAMLVFSMLVIYGSSSMPLAVEFAPGYGFFPFWLGILMAFLSVLLYLESWRKRPEQDSPAPTLSHDAFFAVLSSLGLVILFAFALERVGFIIVSLLFVFIIVHFVEKESRRNAAIFSIAFTAALFVLFQILLGINLPKNFLGF